MDSQIDIIENLIREGERFTFENFCLPARSKPGIIAGGDTSEWTGFKIRARNIVAKYLDQGSPAFTLVSKGVVATTQGNGSDKFDCVKNNILGGLKMLVEALKSDVYGELRTSSAKPKNTVLSNKIFIVHGHDQGLKTDVERFLHEIGFVPVVLHREADEGATIIEKFEKHADVGYAIILLTPDDITYTVDQKTLPDAERKVEYRARPNVIFEFGYFVGRLGRDKVCCLHKGNVVLPSDLNGLVYKKVHDSIESQQYSIIRELKAAGYSINI